MLGRIIPNYVASFPNSYLQHGASLSIGSFKTDSNSTWAKYYNYPQTGVSLFYSYLGNNDIFGHEFSAMTFISFNVFNKPVKPYYFKIGLGVAYFTQGYDSILNPYNLNISSPFTWSFQAGVYKTLSEKPGMNLKVGLIFSHGSNGHTELPNFGINSALVSISSQFFDKNQKKYQLTKYKIEKETKPKSLDVGLTYGLGFHEYGDQDGPVGNPKKKVQSISIFFGRTKNNHLRWGLGATFRYYDSYKDQILSRNLTKYIDNPTKNSTNFVIYSNIEFLMSHLSIDIELGINLYKPFYNQYVSDFPSPPNRFKSYTDFTSNIKRVVSTKLGLKLYTFNTNMLPKHNFYLSPNIKANSGQADFTEIAFGYVYRLN